MPIAAGTRLGQYEVQDVIGQGAMGVVYRAYHPELERTVAVKVIHSLTPDPAAVLRFRHEAQAIAKLRHPNIVDVYDFGEYQGSPYMIVEFVAGGSLAGRLSQGLPDRPATLKLLRGIASGLDYAHAHGVVHRDVKPANVLLTPEDSPVLADFGLAKLMQGSSLKSMTGVTTGTPAYMAPEQVTGERIGPAADRYSLATIAYEMLTGVIPFDGVGLMELLYAQVHRYPTPPSGRSGGLGPAVDAVIMRGLAKNPADRWESCAAFVAGLEHALESEPATSVAATMVMSPPLARTRPLERSAVVAAPAAAAPDATVAVAYPSPPSGPPAVTPTWKPPLRRRRIAIAVAALLALLLVLGVCAAVAQATTLTVNPTRAARGETVRVTATHVPANQAGEIQLHSIVHTYPFTADADGRVAIDMTVPDDADAGDHVVKICWDNACHRDAALRVVAGVAGASPSPTPGGSPNPSPSSLPSAGTSPTPGSTPHSTPTATPTSTPGSTPKSSPAPSPSPTPTSNPCPGNSNALVLSPASQTIVGGSTARFSGSNFTPNSTVTVTYKVGTTYITEPSVTASCTGGISVSVVTNSGVARTDHVVVCDIKKSCVTETLTILL